MADNVPSYYPTSSVLGQGQETQPRLISQAQIEQISQNLMDQISKSIKDMKVLSSEVTPESQDAELFMPLSCLSTGEETPKKRGKRHTTKVVAEFSLSYEIPTICIQNNIDMDNSLLGDESASDPTKCHQFSFLERLQNWTLRLRERTKGKHCDVYYNHMMSGYLFRSKKEVVNFMIYEKYPTKPTTNKKQKKLEVMEASSAASNNGSLGEEQQKRDEEIDQMAINKEKVVKFLSESYENLMNRDSHGPK